MMTRSSIYDSIDRVSSVKPVKNICKRGICDAIEDIATNRWSHEIEYSIKNYYL